MAATRPAALVNDELASAVREALRTNDRQHLERVLPSLEAAAPWGDAWTDHLRGRVLAALGRTDAALEAQRQATERDDSLAPAHYSAGVLLAALGRHDEARQRWERAVELEPGNVDALYNLGQFHYNRSAFEAALLCWRRAEECSPGEFEIVKKVVQAERALGRWDDANRTMQRLVDAWRASPDPRVSELSEVVVDQFTVAGRRVMALEMLRRRDPDLHYETMCRVLDPDGSVAMTVQLESSAYGREQGIPYVVGLTTAAGHRAVGPAFKVKPSYRTFRGIAVDLIEKELGSRGN